MKADWKNRIGGLLVAGALLLVVSQSQAVGIMTGRFEIVEASPWKIRIIEGMRGHEEHTGLPLVTPDKWNCEGALPTEADVGKVFEFEGTVPDMGGVYRFSSKDKVFRFTSKWRMPEPAWNGNSDAASVVIVGTWGLFLMLLFGALVVALIVIIVKRARGRAPKG